jgi:energy-converting hydrogenase Eha subunit B
VLIESVASRWHYLIDLPAGALLAVFIIWLTSRLCPLPPPAAEVERAGIKHLIET